MYSFSTPCVPKALHEVPIPHQEDSCQVWNSAHVMLDYTTTFAMGQACVVPAVENALSYSL